MDCTWVTIYTVAGSLVFKSALLIAGKLYREALLPARVLNTNSFFVRIEPGHMYEPWSGYRSRVKGHF